MSRLALFSAALLGSVALSSAVPAATKPEASGPAAPAPAEETSSQILDKLYARLAMTKFPEEAAGILHAIDATHMQSGSDTADLLMSRALEARSGPNSSLALQLFDSVVALYPDWSEGWSERATARYQAGDVNGAVGDLAQTLKREPRDVGALAGVAAIMLEDGKADEAVHVYDRALALAPAYEPLTEGRTRARTMLWGQTP